MGIPVDTHPFYSAAGYRILYTSGHTPKKVWETLLAYGRRFRLLFNLSAYDTILVQRSVTPLGPPILEWLIVKVLRKQLIYDFDDAIWIPDPESSMLVRLLKFYPKVGMICRWSHVVVTGNDYLADYARRFNDKVVVIPTVVDTDNKYVPGDDNTHKNILTIGWTGSHSTLRHLELIASALDAVQKDSGAMFRVIANQRPTLPNLEFEFEPWRAENEITELDKIDIGVMPLYADPWAEGKCGFKAIQFMAMGKPVVVTPLGVNKKIVDHSENGYLAETTEEWIEFLLRLIRDVKLRKYQGNSARQKIVRSYSIRAALPAWQRIFRLVE